MIATTKKIMNNKNADILKETILKGNMEQYIEINGTPYTIGGPVLDGNKLGRTIGMPTINQIPENGTLLPPFGVYFSEVTIEGNTYKSITNIGRKPTVNSTPQITVETYIYNFNQDVYGSYANVALFHHKRGEIHFNSIDELKAQMKDDIKAGATYCPPAY